ncbi:MAG: ABC transporter ATP-binding protein [Bacillota bacterium]|nr:ABC transporter ATP-binding protein [Bacillota bacterium]
MHERVVLEVKNLTKAFGGKRAVDDISFAVEAGDIYGFLGPNGAGKTTTIRLILGLIHKDFGSVRLNGYNLEKDYINAIANVGAVVETPKFYSYLSGHTNLTLIANMHPKVTKNRIDEVLEMVGLTSRAKDKVQTYSLGMRQRLGIARALLNEPKIVILDEPTNGLDPQGIREVRAMISQLAIEQDITFFISTHLLSEIEQVCNKVAILREGKLISFGLVRELLAKDSETILLNADNISLVSKVLKKADYVKDFSINASDIKVELEKGFSGEMNRLLVNEGIMVNYLTPVRQSLEQYFLELTEGGNYND